MYTSYTTPPVTSLKPLSFLRSLRSDWLVPAGLVALSLVPAAGGLVRLSDLGSRHVTPENARFFAAPAPVILHVVAALTFSLLGAFQFAPALRRKGSAWHRMAGRVLLPAASVVALSGLWMTLTYPWAPGDGVGVYGERLVFGTAMLLSVLRGAWVLLRRRYAEHGDWMIRAYAIGLGAGTQVLTHLPWFIVADHRPGETPRAIMMGLGWVINVAVAEWIIRRPRATPSSRAGSAPAAVRTHA